MKRLWTDGVHWASAATAEEAFAATCKWVGVGPDDDPEDHGVEVVSRWRALPDDKVITCEDENGDPVKKPAAQWAADADGYVGSSEY